ncbi:MAG: glycosyltransferase family 2 protein [Anaerolineae bacterium]|nr:glycosyltransferase family 2 protein [Anaerolineae bacterium]
MPDSQNPLVSIIVPTYNEEADIARTMDALAAQTYPSIEVVVVDASRDRTPEIVQSYSDRIPNLRLLRQRPQPGVSVARNDGLRAATGEIVVILNADVFPEPDFVERIVPHYQNGADYLSVDSKVANLDHAFPCFIQAQHVYDQQHNPEEAAWTEGFSCRLAAALDAGGFPETFGRNTAGEDGVFTERLSRRHYRHAADFSIVVPHVAPAAFCEYWVQRLGRGRGGAYRLYVHEKRPLRWGTVVRSVIGTWFLTLIGIPALIDSWRLTPYSPRGRRDLLALWWARTVEMAATGAGYWNGCREIARLGLNKPA